MEVTVRLFAMLRERAGTGSVTLELPEGARVRDALDSLSELADRYRIAVVGWEESAT